MALPNEETVISKIQLFLNSLKYVNHGILTRAPGMKITIYRPANLTQQKNDQSASAVIALHCRPYWRTMWGIWNDVLTFVQASFIIITRYTIRAFGQNYVTSNS